MKNLFSFPSFYQLHSYDKRFLKRLRSRIRYYFYRLTCFAECQIFVDYLNQNPLWTPIFTQSYYRCNAVLRKYCDNRFSKRLRVQAIMDNFSIAEQVFGHNLSQVLVKKNEILLSELTDELDLYLTINKIDPFEGFFAMDIRNKQGKHLYDSAFSFITGNKLLMTSIQGPSGDNAQELVKFTTKQLHGVRPMFMLVNAYKLLAQTLDLELLGITHKNQGKYRWNDNDRLLFNYDDFWQENGASLNAQGYWQLPLEIERKPLEDIQSKKRSMYRKRYEMLDTTAQKIRTFFIKENLNK
ncbi:arginine ABC transporter membrane protein [Canicola haemoglobinophilus]|uniref:Arginine ABC transporter membrane protein n=1 Tax=Canicola haemoglobinophilus TaxID=733 RepID=A0AB38H7W0_9PAST|nr:VirK/YbjX family protein [Canicola haemoglobinophilus]STO53534.1 arginine ABC transporter membrane protein [Canicola haemoglobinophilus]STO68068.1 arginine ABC transporter membrane protein [Canicola haemoglobinophilus]